jgi:hypothetical protein
MRWPKPLLEHGKSGQVSVATFLNFDDDFLQLVAHVNVRRSVEPRGPRHSRTAQCRQRAWWPWYRPRRRARRLRAASRESLSWPSCSTSCEPAQASVRLVFTQLGSALAVASGHGSPDKICYHVEGMGLKPGPPAGSRRRNGESKAQHYYCRSGSESDTSRHLKPIGAAGNRSPSAAQARLPDGEPNTFSASYRPVRGAAMPGAWSSSSTSHCLLGRMPPQCQIASSQFANSGRLILKPQKHSG